MKSFLLSTLILFCIPAFSQNKDEAAILKMLQAQEKEWNNGNLDAFMKGYWQNDSLLFIGKNGPKYGYNTTLENYKKGYPDTARMGKFTSTILSIKKLSKEYYFVVGKWYLKRTVGDVSGHYTLLIRKTNGEWVIIADHSS
jgi:ketosteroid isomerase-like protein